MHICNSPNDFLSLPAKDPSINYEMGLWQTGGFFPLGQFTYDVYNGSGDDTL